MTLSDKRLGMDRNISRRDMLHGGAAALVGLATLPAFAKTKASYPPALMGLRGNHPGSFDIAHKLGREGVTAWGDVTPAQDAPYDLIIVGAGISGLAAAWFYAKDNPGARILILDNHDDFGGHARRNEFMVDGTKLIGYGGSQTLQEPSLYSKTAKRLLKGIGVKLRRFESAYDQGFYARHGLRPGLYFDKTLWGERQMVAYNLGNFDDYLPLAPSDVGPQAAAYQMPISESAKAQMARLLTLTEDQMPDYKGYEKLDRLYSISYRAFLEEHVGITEPGVFDVLQDLAADSGVGIEAVTAFSALSYGGLPGWAAAGLPEQEPGEPYIHHFPDGNSSIARLIIRDLIPAVALRGKAEDLVTSRFEYAQLDTPDAPVKVRLSSTAVNVTNTAGRVAVTYVKDGQAMRITGSKCVLACNHSIIPYLCPEMPEDQREALAFPEKTPILYTTVAIRNWQAWKTLGIGAVYAPGSYYVHAKLDFPVSMGGYDYPDDPSKPVLVHMERFPHVNNEGLTKREQSQAGRYEMLSTSFEDIERETRQQLAGMLGPGGFDPARDIAGITANRWAHGYAYSYSDLFDETYEDWDDPRMPHMRAKKPFGNITIANSDSAAIALLDRAVDEGYRAVQELAQS
ncbi:MAG: NAD(P)-binding protein [Pseudomonadota bacterium]